MEAWYKRLVIGVVVSAGVLLWPATRPDAVASSDGITADVSQQELPPGVTAEKIAQGEELYASAGCVTCHGPDAKGKPGMTSDLTDSDWKFAEDGTFEALVKAIKDGLSPAETGGMPMPAAASRDLTDQQVEALAAYAWSISHSGS